jgi:hypothetical protein
MQKESRGRCRKGHDKLRSIRWIGNPALRLLLRIFYSEGIDIVSRDVLGIGRFLIFIGVLLGIFGAVENALGHYAISYLYWAVSNPVLFVWAWGARKEHWNGSLSYGMLMVLYAIYTLLNMYAMWLMFNRFV